MHCVFADSDSLALNFTGAMGSDAFGVTSTTGWIVLVMCLWKSETQDTNTIW